MRISRIFLVLLVGVVAVTLSLMAQTSTGGLSGTVLDETGGAVINVQITIRQETTGTVRTTYTDVNGRYSVANLSPGSYSIKAVFPGFETLVRPGVVVPEGGKAVADLTLKAGRVGTEVTVNENLSAMPTVLPTAETENIVNQEDYINTPALSIADIFALSPGVTTQQGNGPRDISLNIRGSNAQQTYGIRNIVMQDDGFPVTQPDGLGRSDINDPHAYDEVDVVEGPQSALYGDYALGGYVNEHMRQVQGIEVGTDFGSFGYKNDYLSAGSSGETYSWTAFLSNVKGNQYTDHTGYDTFTADMIARISLTPKDRVTFKFINNDLVTQLSIRLTLDQYEMNPWQRGCASLAAAGCASVSLYANGFNGTRVPQSADQAGLGRHDRRTIVGARWEHDLTAHTLLSTQFVWDFKDINQPTGATTALGPTPSYRVHSDLTRHGSLWGLQSMSFVTLAFGYEGDQKSLGYNLIAGSNNPMGGQLGAPISTSISAYWHAGIRARQELVLARRWTAVLGAGYEHTGLGANEETYTYPIGAVSVIQYITALRTFDNFAPSAAIRFQATPTLAVHSDVGTGYGTPATSNLFVTPQGVYGNNTQLKAQTNVGPDLGVDWKPGPYLLFSAAGFYEWFHNELVTQSPGVNLQSYTFNAPASAHRGVEAVADFRPLNPVLPGLRVRLNYILDRQTYSQYTEQLTAGNFTKMFNRAGNLIPGVIPQFVNMRLAYDQPKGSLRGFGGFIEERVGQGFYLDNANLLRSPGTHVVNLNLHYTPSGKGTLSRFTFYLQIDNLMGNPYVASYSNITDSLNTTTGLENGAATLAATSGGIWAGPPRSVFGGMRILLTRLSRQ